MRAVALPRLHSSFGERDMLADAGAWGVAALALALPFELTQRPLIQARIITVTNLKLLFYAIVALALATLAPRIPLMARSLITSGRDTSVDLFRHRLALRLFLLLLIACGLSSLLAHDRLEGLKWTLDVLMGGLLWLAMPFWLAQDTERKIRRIAIALVAGAAIAALVGIGEIVVGAPFDEHLRWFKVKPTTAGPYLRLSGTFQYANIAAMYMEVALAFAVAGATSALWGRAHWACVFVWVATVDLLLAALLLTFTRGAILGLAIAVLVLVVATRNRWSRIPPPVRKRWLLGAAANLFLVLGVVVASAPSLVLLRLTSESDQSWYQASYKGALPSTIRAGQEVRVPVEVINRGPLTWYAGGAHAYRLSYHWLYPSRKIAILDGLRTLLPSNVSPGSTVRLLAFLRAPGRPGKYLLTWDLVEEKVTWFSFKSGDYLTQPVRIVGPATPSASSGAIQSRNVQSRIPSTAPQPSRTQLWAAGFRMLLAHPLLGVGPGGYRLNYGDYTRPRQRTWDKQILANSLPVETFADLGLAGASIFWAFLAAVLWTLIAGVTMGSVSEWWQLAVMAAMAAFLGHGLVDYFLGSDAIFVLFWLLCGFVTTAAGRVPPDLSDVAAN